MILNASETAMKNIFSDNQHSEIHLSKINSTNKKDISPKQPESQKDILVSASSMPKKKNSVRLNTKILLLQLLIQAKTKVILIVISLLITLQLLPQILMQIQ
ncbi:hypothetical protein [Borrelia miyamotoi]|uniref:hypothetical protein n=1 Tax=Borrelia miyamotoi TaxID=47466 RepID=UPI00237EF930|nr:hypothetical protein [Borrelia miyamotoi]WDS47395.1 hypothetical protein EZU72_007815 [Borrelia miyamotoi]